MTMRIIDCPQTKLKNAESPEECWLRCDECSRFFQYKSMTKADRGCDLCPFAGCHGFLGLHVFFWDDMREEQDPRWPSSTDELHHGLQSPDMEVFYETQLANRIGLMAATFAASPESADFEGPQRYISVFLKLMSDLSWDLTETSEPAGADSVRDHADMFFDQLPVWSQTSDRDEAPRMVTELRSFFRFAHRTQCINTSDQWLKAALKSDLEELMLYTMQTDPRLKPKKTPGPSTTKKSWTRPKPKKSKKRKPRSKPQRRK